MSADRQPVIVVIHMLMFTNYLFLLSSAEWLLVIDVGANHQNAPKSKMGLTYFDKSPHCDQSNENSRWEKQKLQSQEDDTAQAQSRFNTD